MPKVSTYNITGAQTGEIELNDSVFGIPPKLAASFAVVAESLGNKKEPAGPV